MKKFKHKIKEILYKIRYPKSYVSCKWLEGGIIFDHCNILRTCCSQSHEGKGRYILQSQFYGDSVDWEKIFELKKQQRAVQKSGNIVPSCKGCPQLELKNWKEEPAINMLLLTHWTKCNSECIYCPAVRDEELININKHYNIIPTIKNMMESGVLRKNAFVSIAGGEATIYPEFDELLHLLLDYGMKNIIINSSGVKYSDAIARGLALQKVDLLVSLDAGTPKTHKKIKLVDSFSKVKENLKKYVQSQYDGDLYRKNSTKNQNIFIKTLKSLKHKLLSNYPKNLRVATKYIICPDVNDNIEEIEAWIKLNKELKIKKATLDVELNWFSKNQFNIPKNLYTIIQETKKLAKKYKIDLQLIERASMLAKEYKER